VLIDSPLTTEAHVRNVVRSCFYQLRQLRSIRRSLPDYQQTLAEPWLLHSSLVGIDYCNGVLYGVSSQVIRRLQMVLNAAARLVVGVGRYEHIPPRPLATWFIATTNIVQDSNLCVWLWQTRHVARNYEGGALPLPSLRPSPSPTLP